MKEKYPFIILGVVDSTDPKGCEIEPLLEEVKELVDRKELTYPLKDKKNKKIIRKEIPIVRVDVNNREDLEKWRVNGGVVFHQVPRIYFSKESRIQPYEGYVDSFPCLFNFM